MADTLLPDGLRLVEAVNDEHFTAMSLIHALGWRDTYPGFVPDDYMEQVITDDHWVEIFRANHREGIYKGLLLYHGDLPVACLNYGPAREPYRHQTYQNWGEITSFYTHPAQRGKGYGGILFREVQRRLKADGFEHAFVLVLRENEGARKFYAAHGFAWDGTHEDIPFPPDAICVDLRYVKKL